MYSVHYGNKAETDLEGIFNYIALQLRVPETAADIFDNIVKAVNGLDHMPSRFGLWPAESWASRGIHKMPVGNYAVLYLIDETRRRVDIVRIIYRGRDISKQLTETFD